MAAGEEHSGVYMHKAIMHMPAQVRMCVCAYVHRRLGGVSSPLGRPPRNREIVSCRACVRAKGLPGGNAAQRGCSAFSLFPFCAAGFPFSLCARRAFPFPLLHGGLSLFPGEISFPL